MTAETRARRDGCDCLPYIARCAHFEDDSLFLTDRRAIEEHKQFMDKLPRFLGGRRWSARPDNIAVSYFYEGDDESDAIAAFYEAEARLLTGDDQGIAAPR